MTILNLIVLAMIGEAIWETTKMIWQDGKISIDRVGAVAVSELLTISTGTNIFSVVGISLYIPYLGIILTGLLISRGSNFMHDLLASISNIQRNTKS
jgi:hypothetical protein